MVPMNVLHIVNDLIKAFIQLNLWFPTKSLLYCLHPYQSLTSTRNIGLALTRIILGQVHVNNLTGTACLGHHLLCQLSHSKLHGITQIKGANDSILLHHQYHTLPINTSHNTHVNQIINVLE